MRTILTEERKETIDRIKKQGFMSCWDEFSLIPTIYEEVFLQDKMKEVNF